MNDLCYRRKKLQSSLRYRRSHEHDTIAGFTILLYNSHVIYHLWSKVQLQRNGCYSSFLYRQVHLLRCYWTAGCADAEIYCIWIARSCAVMVYSNNTQLLRWTLINLVDACDNYSPFVTQRMSFQISFQIRLLHWWLDGAGCASDSKYHTP